MKKYCCIALMPAILLIMPLHGFAWGKRGHEIVAEIAFSLMKDKTKANVRNYLGTTSIQQASTWMDDIRGEHKYDHMRTWHYVNIDKGMEYTPTKEMNIINALNKAIGELEHRDQLKEEDIKTDILVIFHLAGDFQQPLHVGYGVDKGGNDIQVKYLGRPNNLHHVWDTEIIEGEHITPNECLLLYNTLDKDEIAQLKDLNIEKWVREPRSLLSKVYAFNQEDNSIDQAYIDKNKKIVEMQLLVGGIRLAAVLEKLFG